MTTRSTTRRSRPRAARQPMTWYNDAADLQSLAGSSARTVPLFQISTLPEGFIAGFTILRLILRITYGPSTAATIVNAVNAIWVATRPSLVNPPNLNADLLDYYYYEDLQSPSSPVDAPNMVRQIDLRSKRRVRGEDRGLFWRVENNETTLMQCGMSLRALLVRS